jgi:hypothetical protein
MAGKGGNRTGNKLPDEGYWKYCHNSKQAEAVFWIFSPNVKTTGLIYTKITNLIFRTLKLYHLVKLSL